MAVNIHNLIAAISPDTFCDPKVRGEVKKIVKEELEKKNPRAYLEAAKKAKPVSAEFMDFSKVYWTNPTSLPGLKNPIEKHSLVYDSLGESLEPLYFWILDFINGYYGKSEKLIDNFVSAPGSGHFSEIGAKATRMQEEGMKILGAANQVIKSILNILYDLKEFKLRLGMYEDLRSDDGGKRQSAMLSLKQVWIDTVDMKRGNTAIKMMAQQYDYVTIIDAFMAAENTDLELNGHPMDLNERVMRILKQRIGEFFRWITQSEIELKKRYEIEKRYLQSQVNTVNLYARWAKPYLTAAQKLEQRAEDTSALVTLFETALFELVVMGVSGYNPDVDIKKGELPPHFKKYQESSNKREYRPVIIVEIKYRTNPDRFAQGKYSFRGRMEATFTSYVLHDQELEALRDQMTKDDLDDVMEAVTGATDDSLAHIQNEIDDFLNPDKEKKKEEKKKGEEDLNPFTSLFPKKEKDKDKWDKTKPIRPDNDTEKVLRSHSIFESRKKTAKVYDTYKKAHGMPALPNPFPM